MSSVDDRIVNMQFNNQQFQSGAAESTKSLENLEKTIGGMGKGTGLNTMGQGVDGIKAKFSAMQIVGVSALATIASKAASAGLNLLKGLTVGPILDGFHEYETNLNSIQTIMANTGKSVTVVNKYLQQLNAYSDLTIYSFSQMASAIGKFTAAGVNVKTATSVIKGIANTAALSGSSVDQMNTAMYQMSQAISTGTIRLQDWNSLANAGMGGSNIREALMATNRTLGDHGKLMDASIKKQGSFRDSLRDGWLNAKTFNKTMKIMAGTTNEAGKTVAFSVEQLRKMGYAKDAAEKLHDLSAASIDSATKVKTFSQLIDVVKESIGSGWGKVFQDLFGNFKEATNLWTGVSKSITGVVSNIFNGVDQMLLGWRKLGGFQNLWTGFANIFKTLGNLIMPFVDAFKAVAPATGQAGSGLAKLTKGFADVTGFIEKLSEHASALTPYLITLFETFKKIASIGGAVVSGLSPIFDLLKKLGGVVGNMVSQGADIGSSLISGILQGLDPSAIQAAVVTFANNIVTWIKGALGIHSPAAELVPVGVAIVQGVAQGIISSVQFIFSSMNKIGAAIVAGMKQMFGGFDALDFAALLNAIFTGGFLLMLSSLTKNLNGFIKSMSNITAPFQQLTATLKTMQQGVRAKIILDIAIAVGILSASLIALSFVKPEKIAVGLGAIASLMGTLVGSLFLLKKIDPKGLVAMSFALTLMASAIAVLTGAIAILGNLDMTTLEKGLGAIAVGLGIMVLALKGLAMGGLAKGLPAAAAAMYIMSAAMIVMAAAVLALGSMDVKTLGKGLGAIAVGMGIFTTALLALTFLGPGVAAAASGIFIVASAMIVMAGAVLALGKMDPKTLAKGLGAMAYGLGLFTVSLGLLALLGPEVLAAGAGILLVATAMLVMANAIGVVGSLSVETIAKGLGAISIGFGLLLAAAGAAIFLAPGLVVLGASVAALGLGLALAGAGLLAAATAFSILAIAGTAGIAVLTAGFIAFMALLPSFAIQVAASVVTFVQTIAAASPKLREAFGTIIESMLGVVEDAIPHLKDLVSKFIGAMIDVVTENIPKIGKLFQTLIDTGLHIIRKTIPEFVDTGLAVIEGFLDGVAKHLPKIIKSGTDIIVSLIQGIADAADRITKAAAQAILDFINGLADAIDTYAPQLRDAGINLARAIVDGLTGGLLSDGISAVQNAITSLLEHIPSWAKKLLHIHSPSKISMFWGEMIVAGLVKGITDNIKSAVGATIALANAVVAAGDKVVAKAQRAAEIKQLAADKAGAKAHISDQLATKAEKEAKKSPKNKALEKAAEIARKLADKQDAAAQKAQEQADAAAAHVTNVREFQQGDNNTKGDMLTDQAQSLSDRASKMLAQANAEAVAAKKLRGKERAAMLKQAKEDAKAAKELADQSRNAQQKADEYYAKSVNDRIASIEATRKAEEQAAKDQATFDAATDTEKVNILQQRAIAAQQRAASDKQQVDALIAQARSLANTDAVRANELLDQAESLAQDAKDAAAEAQQDQEQAKQFMEQAKDPGDVANGTGGSSTTTSFQLSRTAMEDAAKAIDRYTESLRQAEEAAQAATPVYQFVQNNNSPESLSDSAIYRQTKNLLSAAEVKMVAPA